MGTEKTNLVTNPVGRDVTRTPATNRKTAVAEAVRAARRIRY
jgi:hypothetical protein